MTELRGRERGEGGGRGLEMREQIGSGIEGVDAGEEIIVTEELYEREVDGVEGGKETPLLEVVGGGEGGREVGGWKGFRMLCDCEDCDCDDCEGEEETDEGGGGEWLRCEGCDCEDCGGVEGMGFGGGGGRLEGDSSSSSDSDEESRSES